MGMPVVTPARLASVLAAITQLWTAPANGMTPRGRPCNWRSACSSHATKKGMVKLRLAAVSDAQHGGFATGWSPASWGSIDEFSVNLTMPSVHTEYDAVLEAVVTRLQEVSNLISAARGATSKNPKK